LHGRPISLQENVGIIGAIGLAFDCFDKSLSIVFEESSWWSNSCDSFHRFFAQNNFY
jgi:hypothetical protein